jgi:hypothetical protein
MLGDESSGVHGAECINGSKFSWCRCSSAIPDNRLREEGPSDNGNSTGPNPEATDANACQWSSQGARTHGQYPCHRPPSTCGYLYLYLFLLYFFIHETTRWVSPDLPRWVFYQVQALFLGIACMNQLVIKFWANVYTCSTLLNSLNHKEYPFFTSKADSLFAQCFIEVHVNIYSLHDMTLYQSCQFS